MNKEKIKKDIIKEFQSYKSLKEIEIFLNKISDDLYHNLDNKKERLNRLKKYLDSLKLNELKDIGDDFF
jgi:hypothetical protein